MNHDDLRRWAVLVLGILSAFAAIALFGAAVWALIAPFLDEPTLVFPSWAEHALVVGLVWIAALAGAGALLCFAAYCVSRALDEGGHDPEEGLLDSIPRNEPPPLKVVGTWQEQPPPGRIRDAASPSLFKRGCFCYHRKVPYAPIPARAVYPGDDCGGRRKVRPAAV